MAEQDFNFHRRAAIELNRQETRRRNGERRREPQPQPQQPPEPQPEQPQQPVEQPPVAYLTGDHLPADQALEVMRGAPGREAGWYAVTFGPDGPQWQSVDQPGDFGPRVTAHGEQPVAVPVAPQPQPKRRWWQRWRGPVDPPTSPGKKIW